MDRKHDLPDTEKDKLHLKPEQTVINLPDVEDIPGQEHIKVPPFTEFADTTAASDGEEGKAVFDAEDNSSDVSNLERSLLRKSATESSGDIDEENVEAMALDNTDEDGTPLNEGNLATDRFGEDLDMPEAEETDEEE